MANNSITALPENIGNMQALESLNLAGNDIEELPKSMLSLHLQFLDLSGNPISEDDDVFVKLMSRGCQVLTGSNTPDIKRNNEKEREKNEETQEFLRNYWG